MTEQERKAVDEYAKKASQIDTLIISNSLNESMKAYCEGVHNGILMGAQFLDELRKPSEHKTNVGDDFTDDKIIFGTLPDGTNVITVIGKNIRNESYIRQQVGVHSSVFDVLKKKIESKPSEPETNVCEDGEELVEKIELILNENRETDRFNRTALDWRNFHSVATEIAALMQPDKELLEALKKICKVAPSYIKNPDDELDNAICDAMLAVYDYELNEEKK